MEWVAVCPELDIGLGVPRPTIDLHVVDGEQRLLMPSTGRDLTADMQRYAARKVDELRSLDLAGYILKSKSPSCGLGSTKIHDQTGEVLHRAGNGAFAAVLRERFPELPVAEETTLAGSEQLRQFVAAVLARHSLK